MKKYLFLIYIFLATLGNAAEIKNIKVVNYPISYQEPLVLTAYLDGQFSAGILVIPAVYLGEHLKVEYQVQLMEEVPAWFDTKRAEYSYTYDFWRVLTTGEMKGTLTYSNGGGVITLQQGLDNIDDLVRNLGVVGDHKGVILEGNLTKDDLNKNFYLRIRAKAIIPWSSDDQTAWVESNQFRVNDFSYSVNLLSSPLNGGTTIGGGTYNDGASVTITATAYSGYTFNYWKEDSTIISYDATYNFINHKDRYFIADFNAVAPKQYTITLSSNPTNGGTTSGGGTFNEGTSITVKATANSGYAFNYWKEGNTIVSYDANYNFFVHNNRNLVAYFVQNGTQQYTVTLTSNPTNGGTTTGGGTYNDGASVTVTATANNGYTFNNWTESGTEVSSKASYSFSIHGNRTFQANFISTETNWISQASGTTNAFNDVWFSDAYHGTAVGINGTIYRTTNGGYNWVNQTSGVTTTLFDVCFTDINTGTISGGNGIILRTTDGGANWIQQTSGTTDLLLDVFFTDANNGTISGSHHILRTTNGGDNWEEQISGTSNYLYGVCFTDANNGMVTGSEGTILKTTNGGTTWINISSVNTTADLVDVWCTNSNVATVVGENGTILKTTNGGTNWMSQTSGTSNNLPAVCFTDENNGTIVGANGTVLRTTNGGNTWVKQTSGTSNNLWGVSFTDVKNGTAVGDNGTILRTINTQQQYIIILSSKPTNGGTLSGSGTYNDGANITVTATANNGYTFNNWTENGTEVSSNSSFNFSIHNNRTLVANFSSADWIVYNKGNSGLPDNKILSLTIDALGNKWVGTYEGGLAKFDGTNWTTYNTDNSNIPANYINSVAIDALGNKWVGTYGSGLTKFDGTRWTTYNTGNSGIPDNYINSVAIDALGNKWVGTYASGLTKFDGVNWTTYNTGNSSIPNNYINSVAIDASDDRWIGTKSEITKFNGTSWTTYNNPNFKLPFNSISEIIIDISENKWIGTHNGGLVKFDGTTWTIYNTANSQLPENDVRTITVDALGNKWIGTYGSGLTKFDGTNWTTYNTGNSSIPNNWIKSIALDASDNKWIGTYGGLAVYKEGGIVSIRENKKNIPPNEFLLSQNYPNPFNPITTFKYAVPQQSFVNISIYNLLGEKILTLINEEKQPGNYEVLFDGSNLSSGVYFYKIVSSNFIETKKLILMK